MPAEWICSWKTRYSWSSRPVAKLLPIHQAQLLGYLKLSRCRVGLLINFNVAPFGTVSKGWRINGYATSVSAVSPVVQAFAIVRRDHVGELLRKRFYLRPVRVFVIA